MKRIVVPVRYPLSHHSEQTLKTAIQTANEHDSELSILHVDLIQDANQVTRTDLKKAVESRFGEIQNARYVVRREFLVEETILEEIAAEGADIVVIGKKQVGRLRSTINRIIGDPDIESFLRKKLDCEIVTVGLN
jgi:nucleotide-binding universal stress UspA family protein